MQRPNITQRNGANDVVFGDRKQGKTSHELSGSQGEIVYPYRRMGGSSNERMRHAYRIRRNGHQMNRCVERMRTHEESALRHRIACAAQKLS